MSFGNGGAIGALINDIDGYYEGDLDDIRIYNRAISQDEVQQLFDDKP
jgi:hypothetical protein